MEELFQMRIPEDDKELLRRLSEFYGGSMSTTVRHLIRDKAMELGYWKPETIVTQQAKAEAGQAA